MKRLLIIDDNVEVTSLISEMLEDEAFEIDVAANGSEGIRLLEVKKPYDLIITDVIMPDKDGFDVLNFVKQNDIGIPTIVMSGGGIALASDTALKAIEKDASAVIKKPFTRQQFIDKVHEVLSAV